MMLCWQGPISDEAFSTAYDSSLQEATAQLDAALSDDAGKSRVDESAETQAGTRGEKSHLSATHCWLACMLSCSGPVPCPAARRAELKRFLTDTAELVKAEVRRQLE